MISSKKLPHGINNTIDDAILFLGGSHHYIFNTVTQNEYTGTPALNQYDINIASSLANQLERGLALTEKQGEIGLRLVNRYQPMLQTAGFDTKELINKKIFAHPFRKIDKTRTLHIDGDQIICKSNFIADLVNQFKKRKKPTYLAGTYNGERKEWAFALNEMNVKFLLNAVKGKAFSIDKQLEEINNKSNLVAKEGVNYFPLLTIQDNKFAIINSDIPQEYLEPFNEIDDPVQAVMYSKLLGVTVYDDVISNKLGFKTYKDILLGSKKSWTVNRKTSTRKSLMELINPSKQTMIMVSSIEPENLVEWIDILRNNNLLEQTCVTFRYAKNKEMNNLIKENNINTFDPSKKILITNEKINKNFVKNNINPNLIVVDLANEPSHYKTQNFVASKSLVVYYKHKGDSDGIV